MPSLSGIAAWVARLTSPKLGGITYARENYQSGRAQLDIDELRRGARIDLTARYGA
ncbi:hypothetical protein ACIBG0_04635 [Nocardia sp. NPDC050630]|uniref:hypothetical protein n=1 Tax=Nocardia sp. NPDC050630 TaxID=3364321 RepID=UPI0037A2DCE0